MKIKNFRRSTGSRRQGKLARYVDAGLQPTGVLDPETGVWELPARTPRRSFTVRAEGPLHAAPPDLRRCLFEMAPPLGRTALTLADLAPPPAQTWPDQHWLGRVPKLKGRPLVDAADLSDLLAAAITGFQKDRPGYEFPAETRDALLAGATSFEAAWRHAAVLKARAYLLADLDQPKSKKENYDSS